MTDRRPALADALDKGASGRFYDAMVYLHCTREGQTVLKKLGTPGFPTVEDWCKMAVGNPNSDIPPYTTDRAKALPLLEVWNRHAAITLEMNARQTCAAALRGSPT